MWGKVLAGGVAISVLCVIVAACGGGGSSSGGGAPAPTKTAFLKRANTICDSAVQARSEAMERTTARLNSAGGPTPVALEQEELVSRAIVPADKAMVAELAELTPPAGDSEMVGEIVEGLEEAIRRVEGEPAVAFEAVVLTHADVLAERYGLPECRV